MPRKWTKRAVTAGEVGEPSRDGLPAPRALGFEPGWNWIESGFRCFARAPLVWVAIAAIFLLVSLLLAMVPMVSLLLLPLNVLFVGGMMLGCDALQRGEPLKLTHLFAGFKTQTGPLLGLGGLYLAATLLVMLVVVGIMWPSAAPLLSAGMMPEALLAMSPGQLQSMLGAALLANLVGLLLISPVLMAVWFAPALIVLDGLGAIDAARLSLRACRVNWRPFLLYSFVAMALLLVALLSLGLGLLVVVPVLVASIYAGWRDIFC